MKPPPSRERAGAARMRGGRMPGSNLKKELFFGGTDQQPSEVILLPEFTAGRSLFKCDALAKDVAVIFCHIRGQNTQTMQSRNILFPKETISSTESSHQRTSKCIHWIQQGVLGVTQRGYTISSVSFGNTLRYDRRKITLSRQPARDKCWGNRRRPPTTGVAGRQQISLSLL